MKSPNEIITIVINYFNDDRLPDNEKFVASVMGDKYKGTVESGESIGDCIIEIGKSIRVKELYEKEKLKGLEQQLKP